MKNLGPVGTMLAASILLSACQPATSALPIGPSRPVPTAPAPPPPPTVNGEIAVGSLSPEPGSIVGVFDCDPTLPLAGSRPAHVIGLCTYQLRMTFEVVVDRDIPDARLTVDFRGGDRRCAFATTGMSLAAGTRTTMTAAETVLSDHPHISQPCAFPATTDRIIVDVTGLGAGGLLRREFPYSYTFAMRE